MGGGLGRLVKNILVESHGIAALAAAVFGFAVWVVISFLQQPLLEAHAFRQTQTALTAYWFMHEGFSFAYQTPVAGAPWSIPFEFPLYQLLAAAIAQCTPLSLDASGRLLSFLFLLACLWPAHRLTQLFALGARTFWIFAALLLSSPLYLFWGRTFMVETAALFFTLAFIPFAVQLQRHPDNVRSAGWAGIFLACALLQKITTALPVAALLGLCWLAQNGRQPGTLLRRSRVLIALVLAYALPLALALAWTEYTDVVKARNAMGAHLTSAALTQWNFGTWAQRTSMDLWLQVVWGRVLCDNAGGLLGIAILLSAAISSTTQPSIKRLMLLALLLSITPLLIFTNLHLAHDYYQTATTVFLIAALAIALSSFSVQQSAAIAACAVAVVLLVGSNLYFLRQGYWTNLEPEVPLAQHKTLAIAGLVRERTPPGSAIAVFGYDWSSEVAYYSQRKSFTVAGFYTDAQAVWKEPERYLGGLPLGAIVACYSRYGPTLDQVNERPVIDPSLTMTAVRNCRVLVKHSTAAAPSD